MIFAKNVILSNVLRIKEAFLDYETVDVIIIVHLKKFHIDHSHKDRMSMWFIDVPSGNAENYLL